MQNGSFSPAFRLVGSETCRGTNLEAICTRKMSVAFYLAMLAQDAGKDTWRFVGHIWLLTV